MNTINLHIGLEKTGTTSIQKYISNNSSELEKLGFQVPNCFKSSNHYEMALIGIRTKPESNLLKWANITEDEVEVFSNHLLQKLELQLKPGMKCLVSSEFLTSQIDYNVGPSKIVKKIGSVFDEIEATVFVRRPEQLLISRYTTAILAGEINNFDVINAANESTAMKLLFEKVTNSWEKALSPSKLDFRAFPEKTSGVSVIERYMESVGAEATGIDLPDTNLHTNARLSKKAIALIRKLNQTRMGHTRKQRQDFIARVRALTVDLPEMSFSPEEFEKLSKTYSEIVYRHARKLRDFEAEEFLSFLPSFEDSVAWEDLDQDEVQLNFMEICRETGIIFDESLSLNGFAHPKTVSLKQLGDQAKQTLHYKKIESYSEDYLQAIKKLSTQVQSTSEIFGKNEISEFVPNNIFQYWEPLPPDFQILGYIDTWKDENPPLFDHQLYTFESARSLIADTIGHDGIIAFDKTWHPAMRADIFRYTVLYRFGGWYVDVEHESLFPPNHYLMNFEGDTFLERKKLGIFVNNFMGCIKNSKIILEVLETAIRNTLESNNSNIWKITGPGMLTKVIRRHISQSDQVNFPNRVSVYPAKAFFGVTQIVHNSANYKKVNHWSARVRAKKSE